VSFCLLCALTFIFMVIRKQEANIVGRRLTFFSPDESPRDFKQHGFVTHPLGTLVLYSWVVYFGVGYCFMGVTCVYSYADLDRPQSSFLSTWPLEVLGGWDSFMHPWLLIFTLVHIIGMFLTVMWAAVQTIFMFPVALMSEASHVMIEEHVPFQTDDDLVDPDIVSVTKRFTKKLAHRYKRAVARTVTPVTIDEAGTRHIEYTCVRYVHSLETDRFHPEGIRKFTPSQLHGTFKAGGITENEVAKLLLECGANQIDVYVPGVVESLISEFADFTYVFNSVGIWSYMVMSSWNIGIFWLVLTVSSGVIRSLFVVRPNRKKIQELAHMKARVDVLRDGMWQNIDVADIVLGDAVAIDGGGASLPCDGVVVAGSLVVNESMLTGEPMPINKLPAEDSAQAVLTKNNLAYAGTACLQSTGPHNGKAVLIATAVGALTNRGKLVRAVLFPVSVRFKYNDQLPVVYGMLTIFVIVAMSIFVAKASLGSWIAIYVSSLNTAAQCLNPMLPVSMVMGQSVSAMRLQKELKIGVLQLGRIPIAGKISTMVFDKTGTITRDGMDISGVVPIADAAFKPEIKFKLEEVMHNREAIRSRAPHALKVALGCCHTVTTLRDGSLVGNQVEVSMVQVCGWTIADDTITPPCKKEAFQVVRQLEFDHCRMTSGVVVRGIDGEVMVFLKGSYEIIAGKCLEKTVPADYTAVTQNLAKSGFYVLAVASKVLPNSTTNQQIFDFTRDDLEADLSACGLVHFRNEMKRDSPQAIKLLRAARIRCVICTGDNALTAISVGRECSIVSPGGVVLLGDVGVNGKLQWHDPDSDDVQPVDPFDRDFLDCELAVSQNAWKYLFRNQDDLETIWHRLVVFARMKPDDKINVVKYFQRHDHVVGMCGDGGNDCGSLRAAHAGIALSDAEASMVSPFSTARDGKSLLTVVDLIREGRACLATNIATFQYFVTYALTVTTIKVSMNLMGAFSMSEYVWISMDLLISMLMVWTMTQSKPHDILCDYRPTATLLGPQTIIAILYPWVSVVILTVLALLLLYTNHGWYLFAHPIYDLHLPPKYWLLRGDNYETEVMAEALVFTLINTAYANTYGGDFRKPVLRNFGLNVVYFTMSFALIWLLLTPPSRFNCIFRINCDTRSSLDAGNWTLLAMFSGASLIGGCFYGPQLLHIQKVAGWWFVSPVDECAPPTNADGLLPEVRFDDERWVPGYDELGCYGPNNCLGQAYKWQFLMLIIAFTLAHHLFVKVVLQGHFATKVRLSRRRAKDEAVQARHIQLSVSRRPGASLGATTTGSIISGDDEECS